MALDILTTLTILSFALGLTLSTYILYIIVFVLREQPHMPVMFMGGCWIIFINWMVGAHWDFRPENYPRNYCVASALLYNFGAFCMTSTGLCLCMTTFNSVNAARQQRFDSICRPWVIPPKMKIFFFAYPCVALAIFASLALSFDAIGAEGKWICDITRKDYLWIRLFGYGGIDVLATIPAFVASCMTMRILYVIHTDAALIDQIQERFHRFGHESETKLAPIADAEAPGDTIRISLGSQPTSPAASPRSHTWSAAPLPPAYKLRTLHERKDSVSTHESGSEAAHLPRVRPGPAWRQHEHTDDFCGRPDGTLGLTTRYEEPDDRATFAEDSRQPQVAFTADSRRLHHAPGPELWDSDASIVPSPQLRPPHSLKEVDDTERHLNGPPVKADFKGAFFRILWLDFLFTGIEALAAVSSLRAVTTNTPPTGYDTAFAAVVCASWGPFLVFATTPLILDRILPGWRKLLPKSRER